MNEVKAWLDRVRLTPEEINDALSTKNIDRHSNHHRTIAEAQINKIIQEGIFISLEAVNGKPVVMMPDGDSFEQIGELASFLMHLSILMPEANLDKILIIPTAKEEG